MAHVHLPNPNAARQAIVDRYLFIENFLLKEMAGSVYNLIYPPSQEPAVQRNTQPLVLPAEWLMIARRIRHLKIETEKSEEPYSEVSEKALKGFLKTLPFGKAPSIFLNENGNLRAVWKGSDKQQIALQFRTDKDIQFVFFFKRDDAEEIKLSYGRDSQHGIIRQIEAFNLSHLLF